MENAILNFIHKELTSTYGAEAEEIYALLTARLADLQESSTDGFQNQLNTALYPYLACVDALTDSGKTEEEAVAFVESVREKICPGETACYP